MQVCWELRCSDQMFAAYEKLSCIACIALPLVLTNPPKHMMVKVIGGSRCQVRQLAVLLADGSLGETRRGRTREFGP